MTDVLVYTFPRHTNIRAVEQKYCELLNRYRDGEKLEPEVLDWMDNANTFLITSESVNYGIR